MSRGDAIPYISVANEGCWTYADHSATDAFIPLFLVAAPEKCNIHGVFQAFMAENGRR
jgi:hypothetical protein